MAYTPQPIMFGPTPAGGVTIEVTADRGGLHGWTLLSQSGTPAAVTLNGVPLEYPVTLATGYVLRLQRGAGAALTTLHALAPLDEGGPPDPETPTNLAITIGEDGTLSSNDPRITTNPDGSLSAPDELITVNDDGSLSEV